MSVLVAHLAASSAHWLSHAHATVYQNQSSEWAALAMPMRRLPSTDGRDGLAGICKEMIVDGHG
eukprot:scaffold338609_cov113-Cyclotella_meneghiniana.AAC.1